METLEHDGRSYLLRRFPLRENDPLRAWDAADEYLLRHLAGAGDEAGDELASSGRLLLFNDGFGALAVALHLRKPVSWSDSLMSRRALEINLARSGLDPAAVSFLPANRDPEGPIDLALLKLPRSLAFFEDALRRLRPALSPRALVLTGGMIKHTPARAYALLEEIVGPTRTTLGWKKARLAVTRLDADLDPGPAPAEVAYELPAEGLVLSSGPNVFSREKLDQGTRLLLENLPSSERRLEILDVGCGNGVLALVAALRHPAGRVRGLDESYQAVVSARGNAARAGLGADRIGFAVAADLGEEPSRHYDLILCNPPFHQGAAVGDQLAWGMLHQARRLLKDGGRLLVVGNRHLGYHVKLKRLYDRVRLVASDRRFVVLEAGLPGPKAG